MLIVELGKSMLWDLRYFHFRWLLSLACLHENSKWKPLVSVKCLRPWSILEKEILDLTLTQLEPFEHLFECSLELAAGGSLIPQWLPAKETVQVTTLLPPWAIWQQANGFFARSSNSVSSSLLASLPQRKDAFFLEYYKQVIYLEYLSKKCNLRVYHSFLPTQSLFSPCGQNSTYKTGNHVSFVKFVFVNVWFLYDKDF